MCPVFLKIYVEKTEAITNKINKVQKLPAAAASNSINEPYVNSYARICPSDLDDHHSQAAYFRQVWHKEEAKQWEKGASLRDRALRTRPPRCAAPSSNNCFDPWRELLLQPDALIVDPDDAVAVE